MGGFAGGIISTVSNLVSGGIKSNAADKASRAQENAALRAQAEQRAAYERQLALENPYLKFGTENLERLKSFYGSDPFNYSNFGASDFQADPGYAFRQAEGLKAIQNAAAARGGALGGATLKALQRFNQGLASDEYQRAFDRFSQNRANYNQNKLGYFNVLNNLANYGQNSLNRIGSLGGSTANNISDLWTQYGNAQAAGTLGKAQAWATANDNIANAWSGGLAGGGGGGGGFNGFSSLLGAFGGGGK